MRGIKKVKDMANKPLILEKSFAKIVKQEAVGQTGNIFLIKMVQPLDKVNFVLLLRKTRDRTVVKEKMQKLRRERDISCQHMNNRAVKSWWSCWGFPDKEAAGRALVFAKSNLFKSSAKIGDRTITLFDKTHQDQAKRFFAMRSRHHIYFSDNLS